MTPSKIVKESEDSLPKYKDEEKKEKMSLLKALV
jgi:hypothetical protein